MAETKKKVDVIQDISQEKTEKPERPRIPAPYDSGSIGWLIFGILWPVWGFIVYECWKHYKPECARKAKIGVIVGLIIWIVCFLLFIASCTTALINGFNGAVQTAIDNGNLIITP